MNVIEVGDTFNCDCGFSWKRGQSGSHSCGDGLRKQISSLQQKLDAVLAELEKQEPEYEMFTGHGWMQISKEHYEGVEKNKGSFRVVFTRPAPAINLSELENFALYMADESVKAGNYPDGWQCKASNAAQEYAEACRTAILRNIEEKSK